MWTLVGQIVIGLIQVILAWLKREKDSDAYAQAREEQRRAYEEAGLILEGSGEEITRLAQYRARAVRAMLRSRKLRKKADGNADGGTSVPPQGT